MFGFRLLRRFVVVAEELNFRRAATRLHMEQPPLSVTIRNLETQVGTSLFYRSKHHVQLTQAREVFYRDTLRLLRQAQQAVERARRTSQGLEGPLRLSFVPSATLDLLPLIFKPFPRDYPAVQLRLTADNTRGPVQALRNSETDLADTRNKVGYRLMFAPPPVTTILSLMRFCISPPVR